MTDPRIETGTYLTETPGAGFRSRCACGWTGPDRGYDVAAAEQDGQDHEGTGCG